MTIKLDTQWIVGFVDGEGCFNLDTHLHKSMRWGLQMQPEFTVVQHEIDIQILHALKESFKCGSVLVNRSDEKSTRYCFRVKNLADLNEKIIPFFEQHSLKTKKNIEFKTFRKICRLMNQNYHTKSLSYFLEVYDLGQKLRIRSQPKAGNKGAKVAKIVEDLRLAQQSCDNKAVHLINS